MFTRIALAAAMILTVSIAAAPARADSAVYTVHGVAIWGFDTVAYHTLGEAVEGSPDLTHEWMGASWRFINAEHRDLFAANPEKYAPAYGGFCAYATAFRMKVGIDPHSWRIVDGRLYLQQSPAVLRAWGQDVPYYIGLADTGWPLIMHDPLSHAADHE